jgi:phosphopantothenoylcysteine decarboxylase/phosphopantothenate--cysteine ligase
VRKRSVKRLGGKTILLCLSGSIAIYRSCDLVRDLREEGADVICIMSPSAQKFIAPLTFRALSGNPVYTDPFASQEGGPVLHTTLADRADLILVCPATANVIARLAQGMADDLITSAVLASRAKRMIVPAMNDNMYANALTQENLGTLRRVGFRVVEPTEGELVCGRKGLGHIAENAAILAMIRSLLST